jgi:hypothetical protein
LNLNDQCSLETSIIINEKALSTIEAMLKSLFIDGMYGGATDMSSLSNLDSIAKTAMTATTTSSKNIEYWIVVTDFIPTTGTEGSYPEKNLPSSPCYVLSSSTIMNAPSMKRFAIETGGRFINVKTMKNPSDMIGKNTFFLKFFSIKC